MADMTVWFQFIFLFNFTISLLINPREPLGKFLCIQYENDLLELFSKISGRFFYCLDWIPLFIPISTIDHILYILQIACLKSIFNMIDLNVICFYKLFHTCFFCYIIQFYLDVFWACILGLFLSLVQFFSFTPNGLYVKSDYHITYVI